MFLLPNEINSNNDNTCLIKCLKKNYEVDKCQTICTEICDCGPLNGNVNGNGNGNNTNQINNLDSDAKSRNNYKKLQTIMDDTMDNIPNDIKQRLDDADIV